MKQRSPLTATLLSVFVPFYVLYWFYVTADDLAKRGAKKPNFALLWAPFVGLALLIFLAIIAGAAGDGETNVFGILALLVGVVSIPALIVCPLIYYYKFSEEVEKVTNGALTKGLLFVLFWFVNPAGVFLTQDKLNTLGDASSTNPTPPATNHPTPTEATTVPPATTPPPANPV